MMTTKLTNDLRSGSPTQSSEFSRNLSELKPTSVALPNPCTWVNGENVSTDKDGLGPVSMSCDEEDLSVKARQTALLGENGSVQVRARFRKVQDRLGNERLDVELVGLASLKADGSDLFQRVSSLQSTLKKSNVHIPFHYERVSFLNPNLNRVSSGLFKLSALNCEKQLKDLFQQVTFEDSFETDSFDPKASRRLSFAEKRSARLKGLNKVKEKELNAFIHVFTKGAFADKHFLLYAMLEKDLDYFNTYVVGMIDSEWRNLARRIRLCKDGMAYMRTKLSIRVQTFAPYQTWVDFQSIVKYWSEATKQFDEFGNGLKNFFSADTFHALIACVDLAQACHLSKEFGYFHYSSISRILMSKFFATILKRLPFAKAFFDDENLGIKPQSGLDDVKKFMFDPTTFDVTPDSLERVKELMNDSMINKCFGLVSLFFCSSLFQDLSPSVQITLNAIRKRASVDFTSAGFFVELTELIFVLSTRFTKFLSSGDITDLFDGDRVEKVCDSIEMVREQVVCAKRSGLASDNFAGYKDACELRDEALRLSIKKEFKENLRFNIALRSLIESLTNFLSGANTLAPPPLGVILTGNPGLGKSTFCEEISSCIKFRLGIPMDVDVDTRVRFEAKHQRVAVVPLVCRFEDALSTADKHITDDVLSIMQQAVEGYSLDLTTASLDEKAKARAHYQAVLLTTNADHYLFSKALAGTPSKLVRRYKVLNFRMTDSCIIFCEENKIKESEYQERWNSDPKLRALRNGSDDVVYTYGRMAETETSTLNFTITEVEYETKSLTDMIRHVNQAIMKKQAQGANGLDSKKDLVRCKICGTPSKKKCLCEIEAEAKSEKRLVANVIVPQLTPQGSAPSQPRRDLDSLEEEEEEEETSEERAKRGEKLVDVFDKMKDEYVKCRNHKFQKHHANRLQYEELLRMKEIFPPFVDPGIGRTVVDPEEKEAKVKNIKDILSEAYAGISKMVFSSIETSEKLFPDLKGLTLGGLFKFGTGVALVLTVMYRLFSFVRLLTKGPSTQGNVLSPLIGVQTERVPVNSFHQIVAPYVNGTKVSHDINSVRVRCLVTPRGYQNPVPNNAFGYFVSHDVMLVNYHVLTGVNLSLAKFKEEDWLGKKIEIMDYEGKFMISCTLRKGGLFKVGHGLGDMVAIFTGPVPGIQFGGFSFLGEPPLSDFPLTSFLFKNTSRLTAKHDPGYGLVELDTPHISENGECGLPYRLEDGTIYAFHTYLSPINLAGGCIVRAQDVQAARAYFEENHLTTLYSSGEITPEYRNYFAQCLPHIKPPGDLAHVKLKMDEVFHQTKDLEAFNNFELNILGKLPYSNRQTMTGRRTVLFDTFSHRLPEEFSPPFNGHARECAGWVSPYTTRFSVPLFYEPFHTDVDLYSKAFDMYVGSIPQPKIRCCILSLEQAMAGDSANVLIGAMKDDTSVGLLHQLQRLTKKELIKVIAQRGTLLHPKFIGRVDKIESDLRLGLRTTLIAVATLKDELLMKSKVDKGKGRLFYTNEKALIAVTAKCFKTASAHLIQHWQASGFVVAINPGGRDWDLLAKFHRSVGSRTGDFDFKNFDNSHSWILPVLSFCFPKLLSHIGYNDDEIKFSMRVYQLVVSGFMSIEGFCTTFFGRMTSGNFLTMFINNLANQLLFRMWLIDVCLTHNFPMITEGEFACSSCGDDLLVTLKDYLSSKPEFSPVAYQKFLKKRNYTLTGSGKNDSDLEWKNLEDCTFLKRGFVYDEQYGRWKAPLDIVSIYKSMSYMIGKAPEQERNQGVFNCMQKECFLHGRVEFEEFTKLGINCGLKSCGEFSCHEENFIANRMILWDPRLESRESESDPAFGLRTQGLVEVPPLQGGNYVKLVTQKEESHSPLTLFTYIKSGNQGHGLERLVSVFNRSTELNSTTPNVVDVPQTTQMSVAISSQEMEKTSAGKATLQKGLKGGNGFYTEFFSQWRKIPSPNPGATWTSIGLFNSYNSLLPVQSMMKNCYLFKGNPEVMIVHTGMSNLSGLTRVCFSPTMVRTEGFDSGFTTPSSCVPSAINKSGHYLSYGLPHLDFDPSCTCTQTILLPYPFPNDHELVNGSNDYTISYGPIIPLVANNSTTPIVTLEFYVRYLDVDYLALKTQSATGDDDKRLISRGLDYLGGWLGAATPWGAVAKLGSAVARSFGYSKPPDPPNVVRTVGDMSSITGSCDTSYTLGQDPLQLLTDKKDRLPGELLSRATLADVWSPWLWKFPELVDVPIPSCPVSPTYFSRLATFAVVHKYWRGEVLIKVKVYANSFIRGKITYNVCPPGEANGLVVTNGSRISGVIDVVGSTEVEISIPWMYKTAYRSVELIDANSPTIEDTTFIYEWSQEPRDSEGTLANFPYVDVDICGKNLDFVYPTLGNLAGVYQSQGALEIGEVYGVLPDDVGQLCKRSTEIVDCVTATTVSQYGRRSNLCFPLVAIHPMIFTGGNSHTTDWLYDPEGASTIRKIILNKVSWTYDTFFRANSLNWSGSSVHRFMLKGSTTTSFHPGSWAYTSEQFAGAGVFPFPGYGAVGDALQYFPANLIEVRTPCSSTGSIISGAGGIAPIWDEPMNCVVVGLFDEGTSDAVSVRWSYSAGDDRQMAFFIPFHYSIVE